jgi:hypothetical protein
MNSTVVADKQIKMNGNSLSIHITNEAKLLGLGYNDVVRITLERIDSEKSIRY